MWTALRTTEHRAAADNVLVSVTVLSVIVVIRIYLATSAVRPSMTPPPRKFQLRHSQTRLTRSPEAARNFSTEQQEWTLTDDGTMADTAGLYLRDDNAKVDIIGLDCMTDRTMRDWKMS